VYVGRSSNVRRRLEDHVTGRARGATLPSVYATKGIVDVSFGENTDHAERVYADALQAELGGDAYVHSR